MVGLPTIGWQLFAWCWSQGQVVRNNAMLWALVTWYVCGMTSHQHTPAELLLSHGSFTVLSFPVPCGICGVFHSSGIIMVSHSLFGELLLFEAGRYLIRLRRVCITPSCFSSINSPNLTNYFGWIIHRLIIASRTLTNGKANLTSDRCTSIVA